MRKIGHSAGALIVLFLCVSLLCVCVALYPAAPDEAESDLIGEEYNRHEPLVGPSCIECHELMYQL